MSEPLDNPQLAAATAWARFGIELEVDQPDLVIATMPMDNLLNPLTDQPAVGPLAVLVDFTTGIVNFLRGGGAGEWTVSSELSLELSPDAMASLAAAPDVPVVAQAKPLGSKGTTALAVCEIRHRDLFIGTGTSRSLYFTPTGDGPAHLDLRSRGTRPTELRDIMAVAVEPGRGDGPTLHQRPDPALNNPYGIMHGGVAAAGLELAASAALNTAPNDAPMQTASLRVNYLREFISGDTSRYEGRCVRAGRRSGIGEARAIGADGALALIGRVTAYRA